MCGASAPSDFVDEQALAGALQMQGQANDGSGERQVGIKRCKISGYSKFSMGTSSGPQTTNHRVWQFQVVALNTVRTRDAPRITCIILAVLSPSRHLWPQHAVKVL